MVRSKVLDFIKWTDKVPAGNSTVVGIMSYSGYDIEDASIWNKSSFDRGFMRSLVFRSQKMTVNSYSNGSRDLLQGLPNTNSKFMKAFSKIESDGLPHIGSRLTRGDVWCCKYEPKSKNEAMDIGNPENYEPRFEKWNKLLDC